MALGFVIYHKKELQAHPMPIIMMIAFADYSLYWNQFVSTFTCELRLPQLYLYTTTLSLNGTAEQQYNSVIKSMRTANFIECYLIQTSLFLSICTTYELVAMIKRPFHDPQIRTRQYFAISFILSLIVVAITRGTRNDAGYYWYLIEFFIYVVSGTFSIVFAFKRLSSSGISQYVRSLVLKRHILYLVLFTLTNLYIVAIAICYI